VQWIETCEYSVDGRRAAAFYAAIRQYWPELEDGALQAGLRRRAPEDLGPAEAAADFRIDDAHHPRRAAGGQPV